MAQSTPAPELHQPLFNSIPPELLPRFDPTFVQLYNKHNAGRIHTHQVPIEKYRANPSNYNIAYGRQRVDPSPLNITEQSCPVQDSEITIRICEPKQALGPRPVYVNFHGGGWVFGDLENDFDFCKRVAIELGCVAFDVGYRLAPEHRFPVPIDDCWAALNWVRDQKCSEFNLDLKRLAIGGISAGGHISAILGHMCRDSGIPLALQWLVVPVTDLRTFTPTGQMSPDCRYESYKEMADTVPLSFDRMAYFHNHFLGTPRPHQLAEDWRVSPICAPDFQHLAPAVIVTAEMDVLRDEGEAYANKMNEAGSQARVIRVKGAPHSFTIMDNVLDIAKQYNIDALCALGKAFGVTAKSLQ